MRPLYNSSHHLRLRCEDKESDERNEPGADYETAFTGVAARNTQDAQFPHAEL
jgi:hypothetical protein